ncbi:MAG TPA: hypothetical protein VGM69_05595 [Chloroflexota bacterium]
MDTRPAGFDGVFAELREVLAAHAPELVVTADEPGTFYLEAPRAFAGRSEPAFFGAVQRRKSYVSYHLMPVYADPSLLEGMSSALKKRMQGKSCFNFTRPLDEGTRAELTELTRRGMEKYRELGLV